MTATDAQDLELGRTVRRFFALLGLDTHGGAADGAELVPLDEAARIAATSKRVLRDAIRAHALAAYGGQRDRSVRRADLDTWIAERRVAPVAGPADLDIDRRVARLAREAKR
jgi:hypothetical protein